MSFIAALSTSAYLLLFAFLILVYAQDDFDKSDIEDLPISTVGGPLPKTRTIEPEYTRLQRRLLATQDSCLVPPQPANGVRRRHRNDCGDDVKDCEITEGVELKPATVLNYTCDSGYTLNRHPLVVCEGDGNWSHIPECIPCGRLLSNTTVSFPWYASLYTQDYYQSEKEFKCGATVVSHNLVLTAASCVYDDETKSTVDPERLFVVAGHYFQKYDHPWDTAEYKWRSVAKEIHMNCDYHGRYSAADIALVEIKWPFKFSPPFQPACLDLYSYGQEVLQPDAWGSITEFGTRTVSNHPIGNKVVSMKTVPYVPYSQCRNSDKILTKELLTSDKFCAGYHNRSRVCVQDQGGGIAFKINDSWHVMGIVSETSDFRTFASDQSCQDYASYTNVSEHRAWIQNVIFNLDRYKSNPRCNSTRLLSDVTTTPKTPLHNRTLLNIEGPACLAPPQPDNGEWRFHQSLRLEKADCENLRDAPLRPGTQLIYRCSPGYKTKGSTEVYCGINGNWSAIPNCTEMKCDPLNSVSTTILCYGRAGEWVNCVSPVPPGTVAEISCQPGYRKDTAFSTFRREVVRCSESGEWTPDPIKCVPVCGMTATHQKPFIINGTSAKLSDFPWHATLYMQENSPKGIKTNFQCGATIIQTNFVLTAAHCIYDERTRTTADPEKLFVVTGNVFRDYDFPLHNPLSVRKTAVKNVYRPCRYYGLRGNYASDIALLELQTPFNFSGILLPACLDVYGHSDQILEAGVEGRVAGFGRTEKGASSGILQTLTLPYISYNECKKSKNGDKYDVFISEDKFCAGSANGSAVCEGDSGGGLVFRKRGLWYVMGIVSVGLGVDLDSGEKTCDRYSYSLYTKVSEHMTWIRDVMFQRLNQNPYPPCDADV